MYSQADIYLLDDTLSAVDAHVAKHVFDNVIASDGILAGKSIIFVTHSITLLTHVDEILVMNDGEITEKGSFEYEC